MEHPADTNFRFAKEFLTHCEIKECCYEWFNDVDDTLALKLNIKIKLFNEQKRLLTLQKRQQISKVYLFLLKRLTLYPPHESR
jgi:hypothetical protein